MTKYEKIIEYLKEMKEDFDNGVYTTKDEIEKDFNKSISLVWEGLNDLYKEDLTDLYQVQRFLINQVCNIHDGENSLSNKKHLQDNLNVKKVSEKLEDGKRAFNIYSFNDNNWEEYLIGDIHSDTISMERILDKTNFFARIAKREKIRLIFLGDYVDRGKAHLKLIQYILTLKYIFPKNIYLQQGNHDGGSFIDGQVKMWVRKPEKDLEDSWFLLYLYNLARGNKTFPMDAIHDYLRFFDSLANISFIDNGDRRIILSHGGIPRPRRDEENPYQYLTSISSLTDESIRDHLGKSIVNNMMWSDPSTVNEDLKEDKGRFRFTEGDFEALRKLIGFDLLIRGHQVQEEGYKYFFNDGLINIFSSGKILENNKDINSETAYGSVNPHIINLKPNGATEIIGLNE